MTDEQIIKALEHCSGTSNCFYCEYEPTKYGKGTLGCANELMGDTLNLIKRQQAEIERLTDSNKRLREGVALMLNNENGIELIKAEAIKEFAEKLIEIAGSSVAVNNGQEIYETKCYNIMAYKLDDIVKKWGAVNDNI